ncbi:ribosome-binding factor A [Skermanella stibiiresistens SB22]|uniref:Ribosome-binding factor A n=1 Tax=Skermanella stibiiresistens SB22 TaxID=1385369 RepID=W9HCE7_9PROT|nr:30S ribosome-binding factor RbfA [Skermanella stibiiresistens]EWY42377.1 ribosome-binding factor A [Skermanella stibiiresistens SB22]
MNSKRAARGPSQRQLRVGEELRHALAEVLRRGDFRDPELQKLNVTVTEVRISPDLRNATAFITPLGGGETDEAVTALRRASAFFRGQMARSLKLRYVPTLSFEADTSFEYADHINRLLQDPEVARDLGAASLDREEDDEDEDGEDSHNGVHNGMNGADEEEDEDDEDDDEELEYEDDDDLDDDEDDEEENEYEDEEEGDADKPAPLKSASSKSTPRGRGRRGA